MQWPPAAAGGITTCALLATGSVRCWGYGADGGLGCGNTNNIGDNETPASAGDVPIGDRAVQVSAGSVNCALLESGNVRCWGFGLFGALGYGNTNNAILLPERHRASAMHSGSL